MFATSSSGRSITNSLYAGDLLLVVADLVMRPENELAGQKVGQLTKNRHVVVISHGSDLERVPFPPGDRFTIHTETLKEVHRLSGDPEPY